MFGNTALHYAVDKSRKESVIWLITNGANINLQDFRGNSPLHVACTNNDIEMVRLLLNRNADPNLTDLANLRPIEKTNLQSIQKLIELKIEELHSKTDTDGSAQTVNWMSFGVGLGFTLQMTYFKLIFHCMPFISSELCFHMSPRIPGVGMGMALAKRQQVMIEQYLEQQRIMDGGTKRGRSIKSGGGSAVPPFSPQAQVQQRVPTHNNSSLIVHQNSSTPNFNNTRTATSDRKFL